MAGVRLHLCIAKRRRQSVRVCGAALEGIVASGVATGTSVGPFVSVEEEAVVESDEEGVGVAFPEKVGGSEEVTCSWATEVEDDCDNGERG